MQLHIVLADSKGCDALVAAGTGSGKTLPIALCILLNDPSANLITITAFISSYTGINQGNVAKYNKSHFQSFKKCLKIRIRSCNKC